MAKLVLNRDVAYEENPPFPHNMLVELTSRCNHRCVFCAHKKMKRAIGNCDKKMMTHIIRQAFELGTREIGFYLTGEPFLNPDLEYYVELCKKTGFEYIYITTNGVLAKKEKVKSLCEKGLSSLKFSINAATKEMYKYIHGRDDYDRVIKNLDDIYELKKGGGIKIPLFASYVIVDANKSETELFKRTMNKYFDDILIVHAANQGGGMLELKNSVAVDNFGSGSTIPCDMIFNRFHITYQGYLTACCVDFNNMMTIADLKEVSLREAWNSDEFIKLRRQHLNNNIGNNMCYLCINNKECLNLSPIVPKLCDTF